MFYAHLQQGQQQQQPVVQRCCDRLPHLCTCQYVPLRQQQPQQQTQQQPPIQQAAPESYGPAAAPFRRPASRSGPTVMDPPRPVPTMWDPYLANLGSGEQMDTAVMSGGSVQNSPPPSPPIMVRELLTPPRHSLPNTPPHFDMTSVEADAESEEMVEELWESVGTTGHLVHGRNRSPRQATAQVSQDNSHGKGPNVWSEPRSGSSATEVVEDERALCESQGRVTGAGSGSQCNDSTARVESPVQPKRWTSGQWLEACSSLHGDLVRAQQLGQTTFGSSPCGLLGDKS